MAGDARPGRRAAINDRNRRVEHFSLVHRVSEKNPRPVGGVQEVNEIDVTARRIVRDARRRATASPMALVASVDLHRRLPPFAFVGRALQEEDAVAVAAHGPPGTKYLCMTVRRDDRANARGHGSGYLWKASAHDRTARRQVAELGMAIGDIAPVHWVFDASNQTQRRNQNRRAHHWRTLLHRAEREKPERGPF